MKYIVVNSIRIHCSTQPVKNFIRGSTVSVAETGNDPAGPVLTVGGNLTHFSINYKKHGGNLTGAVQTNDSIYDTYQLKSKEGAFVVDVEPHSSADKAGIQKGDVIIELNEKKCLIF